MLTTQPSAGASGSESPPGPYLCFQLKHIGDFLMTLPAVGRLRQTGEKVGMVVAPAIAELASSHPWIDEVFVLDRNRGPLRNFQLTWTIARKKYGTAFIFDGQTRSIVTAALAGIKNRIGASGLYPLGGAAPLFTRDIHLDGDLRRQSQAFRSQKMAALALGLPSGPLLRPPPPGPFWDALIQADLLLAELSGLGDGPLIGLTLAGRQHEKSWPLASFAELCRRLHGELQARLFVTGGPSESVMARALAQAAGVPVADFCGRTGLKSVIALAHRSDLFITVDTGTSHLAALTETPLISLFIWTSPAQWPPQSPLVRILCYDWALKRFGLKPDDGPWETAPIVTPAMVFNTAAEILNRQARREES